MKHFSYSLLALSISSLASVTNAQESNSPSADTSDTDIEHIEVVGHNRNYLRNNAESAIGLDMNLLKTPASVSVISQDLLKDLQVNNVDDALRNVAGVTKFKTGNGGEEKFSIRGFDASGSIYKDGARINNGLNVSNIPSTETANIERIEVLKGPSALLYGRGEPGGIINYITKRPQAEKYTNIEFLAGSDSFYKVEVDTTGAFSEGSQLAYRFITSYEDSESFRDEHFRERLLLNPTIAYAPNDWTNIVLGVEYLDDNYTQDRGQVLDGDLIQGYFYSDRMDASTFTGIPNFNDQTNAQSTRIYIQADSKISENWRIEGMYSQTDNDKELYDSNPGFLSQTIALIGPSGSPLADLVSATGSFSDAKGEAKSLYLRSIAELDGPLGTEHQLLVSLTMEEFDTVSTSFTSDDTVFHNIVTGAYFVNDPFTPVAKEDVQIQLAQAGSSTPQAFEERGLNILDYVTINDQFSFLLGGRFSEYKDNLGDFEDDDFSVRTGLVYSADDDLSFYVSYSEGYASSAGRLDANDNLINPETSDSWELGSKWFAIEDQLLITATLYSTEEKDIAFLVNPLAPPSEYRWGNIGAVETQGFELEIVGEINENWRIQAGYAYIDSEITRGGSTGSFGPISFISKEGNKFPGIADNNLNISTIYELPLGKGTLGFGGNIFYQDEVFISGENNGTYDAWTEVGLLTYFKWDAWKAQLNVSNLFDEDYRLAQAGATPDVFAAVRVGTSKPRAITASISYEF